MIGGEALGGERVAIVFTMALADIPSINLLTSQIVKCALEVHRRLGPGLLESVYLACFVFELRHRGLEVETAKPVPVIYRDVRVDSCLRLDALVNDTVIVEIKSIERFAAIHRAQLLSYLRLTDRPVGLLINFNVPLLKQGLKRLINTTPKSSPP